MSMTLPPPRKKNPLTKSREPTLPPHARSRAAQGLTRAAAEGRFEMQACEVCGTINYPPRDACVACLSARLDFRTVPSGGTLLCATRVHISNDVYFRERGPTRVGTILADCGPSIVALLHDDLAEGARVHLDLRLDRAGAAVVVALPEIAAAVTQDGAFLREMGLDARHRRVLITDARAPVAPALIRALQEAGAATVHAGVPENWKPFDQSSIGDATCVSLDVTDTTSVTDLAASIGHKVDILINTAEHTRAGGLATRDLAGARDDMETGYFGLLRLAQAFAPVMRSRTADGVNSACAFVNLFSVHAQAAWPAYGIFSSVQAAALSLSQTLRAEAGAQGLRVVNVFAGPLDTEWFQTVPPPKVAPAALARAVVAALREGREDVYVGDVAEDMRARLAANAKALERELAS